MDDIMTDMIPLNTFENTTHRIAYAAATHIIPRFSLPERQLLDLCEYSLWSNEYFPAPHISITIYMARNSMGSDFVTNGSKKWYFVATSMLKASIAADILVWNPMASVTGQTNCANIVSHKDGTLPSPIGSPKKSFTYLS